MVSCLGLPVTIYLIAVSSAFYSYTRYFFLWFKGAQLIWKNCLFTAGLVVAVYAISVPFGVVLTLGTLSNHWKKFMNSILLKLRMKLLN